MSIEFSPFTVEILGTDYFTFQPGSETLQLFPRTTT